jgi:hypothetical protein
VGITCAAFDDDETGDPETIPRGAGGVGVRRDVFQEQKGGHPK